MIKLQGSSNENFVVLGLGRSGMTSARALNASGANVICWDDDAEKRSLASSKGLRVIGSVSDFDWESIDRLIISPGVPHHFPLPHPMVSAAVSAGVLIDNDVGLFFQSIATKSWDKFSVRPRIVAVTGSNGKSTTASLLHHIFLKRGYKSQLAGNIGRGVLDIDPPENNELIVLELSSYQIEVARILSPDLAIFTNFSADHLERHGGIGGYLAAKRRLFTEGCPDYSIIGVDELAGLNLAQQLSASIGDESIIRVSATKQMRRFDWSIFLDAGYLVEHRKGKQINSTDLKVFDNFVGPHSYQNAASAYAACRALGMSPRKIVEAMKGFDGLAHRSQKIAAVNGITFINDSKATNVESAMMSLNAYENIRWICGGQQKDGGLSKLNSVTQKVRRAYVIGAEAENISKQLTCESVVCGDMRQAVECAVKDSESGDVVLLAPAASSFDQYDNFERRGEDFAEQVERIIKNFHEKTTY